MTSQEGPSGGNASNVGVFNPTTGTISLGAVGGVLQNDGSMIVQSNEPTGGGGGNHNGSGTEAGVMLDNFWPRVVKDIEKLTTNDFKQQELPLARIKKIMKLDDDVKAMVNLITLILIAFHLLIVARTLLIVSDDISRGTGIVCQSSGNIHN